MDRAKCPNLGQMMGVGTPVTSLMKIQTADGHPLRPGLVLGSDIVNMPIRDWWRDIEISTIGLKIYEMSPALSGSCLTYPRRVSYWKVASLSFFVEG